MSSTQRTFTVALWFLVVVSLLGLLAMQRWAARRDAAGRDSTAGMIELNPDRPATLPADAREPLNIPAPSFAFTDQNNLPFDSSQLKGKIWTFSLFFSECQGICPTMRQKFEAVQATTSDPDVHFVLLSVDPERDNPAKLAKYAAASKADPVRSHLLTGDLEETHRVALSFLIPFDLAVNHSAKVMLVDRDGIIRSFYTGTDEAEMARLSQDIKKLLSESK
jgi:cytochrome oxidase Cu insertion factor (SCO1/SenC/PrrC family)